MKHTKAVKRILSVLLVVSLTGFASTAPAQTISGSSKEVSKSTRDDAVRRAGDLGKKLDQDRTKEDDSPKGPEASLDEFKDADQQLSAQELDELQRRLEAKNKSVIDKFDRLLAKDPTNAQKPDWMFQKAERMWEMRHQEYLRERAYYNQCLEAEDQGTASSCDEPVADYSEPQEIYKEILTEFPAYDRLDEVIFRLGDGLIEADKGAEAVSYLQRLVENYPNSKYLPDANLALAEFFFKQEMLGAARDKYLAVLEHEDNPNYDFAMYKLGWVYYNQGEYRDSVNTFKEVVERTDTKLGFQDQAINDLVVAYAEIDGGWIEVRDYLKKVRDEEFMWQKVGAMAQLYEGQGKSELAVDIYEYFIKERPDEPRIPDWMEAIIVAKKKINDFDDLEETMNQYVAYLDADGTWAKKNQDNEGQLNNANLLSQASLAFLSNTYHVRAQSNQGTKDDYLSAIEYYQEFIRRFPDEPAAFDMNFFVADIYLLELDEPEKAATYYQHVIDLYKDDKVPSGIKEDDLDELLHGAAYGMVSVYNSLVMKNHPDSVLVEMAEHQAKHGDQEVKRDKVDSSTSNEPNPKVELLKYEKGFVEASDQFSEMYPEDEDTPNVDYISAEVYKSRGHYDRAIPRYESIIENAPKHLYASYAGGSLLVSNYVLKNWDEVEKWARFMLEREIFEVTPKEELVQAVALAINERAKELKENEDFDEATAELLRLAEEFPESELAAGALFNAGAIYESGDNLNQAVEVYERVVKDYPQSLQAPEALFVMGAIFEARADFERAASYFARMGSNVEYEDDKGDKIAYKNHPQAAEAVYNAGALRAAMEQWSEAIDIFEEYISLYGDQPEEKEQVEEVRLRLGYLETNRENYAAATERFQDYLKLPGIPAEEIVQVNTELGLLAEKTKDRNWEKTADEHYSKSIEAWKNLDEDKQRQMRFYAAQARFQQGERIYEKFTNVKLSFPMSALTKGLQEKGQLEQDAEEIYADVLQFQSSKWSAAATFRIGQMYRDFADQLNGLPIPEGLSEEQAMDYQWALDEQIIPLQDKALVAFQRAQNVAIEMKAYNEWSSRSAEQISKMESATYPITEQEGVDIGHARVKFFVPEPLTDMQAIAEAVAADRAARAPEEPETPEDEAEANEAEGSPQAQK